MFCITLFSAFPEASAVVSAVFMVLTWHSMYPFDMGYSGEEVMCFMHSLAMNLASVPDEKGGPLSDERL